MPNPLTFLFIFILIIGFFCLSFLMGAHGSSSYIESLLIISPLCLVFTLSLLSNSNLLRNSLTFDVKEQFKRDLLFINFFYLLANIIWMILDYNNSDLKAWWPIILYISCAYGLIFSFIYALISSILKNHGWYTNIFSLLILTIFSLLSFYPEGVIIPFLGFIKIFWIILINLFIIHSFIILTLYGLQRHRN